MGNFGKFKEISLKLYVGVLFYFFPRNFLKFVCLIIYPHSRDGHRSENNSTHTRLLDILAKPSVLWENWRFFKNFRFWGKTFSFHFKTEGYKEYSKKAKLKVFKRKPSVLLSKKSKQKENRTEGNKGTPFTNACAKIRKTAKNLTGSSEL